MLYLCYVYNVMFIMFHVYDYILTCLEISAKIVNERNFFTLKFLNCSLKKVIFHQELLKIVYIDEGLSNLQDTSMTPLGKDTDSKNGVRCMQISPSGLLCAAGDRSGNLR